MALCRRKFNELCENRLYSGPLFILYFSLKKNSYLRLMMISKETYYYGIFTSQPG